MLRLLRQLVWWPSLSRDVTEMRNSCIACQVNIGMTVSPPMIVRETPQDVFQHVNMDSKGLVGGDFYLLVMIDNIFWYPVVQVVKSTKISELKPRLEEMFTLFGVPTSVTI